jgi:peptide methionine sulfoxide reductase msrA/msrB
MNSAALRFVPVEKLVEEGYERLLPMFEKAGALPRDSGRRETAILAGGCFWGMEEIARQIPGVLETEVGYTGGTTKDATYSTVKTGTTGHAESLKIVFDPARLAYEDLLAWFFRMHDPTTKNRQGGDVGSQYRSAIFYASEAQRHAAEAVRANVEASGKWRRPIATEIVPASDFWPAEEYHQDYLVKNPGGYTCHFLRDFEFTSEANAAREETSTAPARQ